jgi:hypothetical protein
MLQCSVVSIINIMRSAVQQMSDISELSSDRSVLLREVWLVGGLELPVCSVIGHPRLVWVDRAAGPSDASPSDRVPPTSIPPVEKISGHRL